jgi:murein DD-endopeptidase MepM/ murein hydrolase activator NlpD
MREVLYALPNRMPVSNFSVSSDFGIRKHPISGLSNFHTGMDLLSETEDDNVHPVKPGIVVLAKYHSKYGNTVVVRHSNGIESLYGHLANMKVDVGDKVTTETVLGRVGNTGVSTGKHLHLEILVGGYPVNPPKSHPNCAICSTNSKPTLVHSQRLFWPSPRGLSPMPSLWLCLWTCPRLRPHLHPQPHPQPLVNPTQRRSATA